MECSSKPPVTCVSEQLSSKRGVAIGHYPSRGGPFSVGLRGRDGVGDTYEELIEAPGPARFAAAIAARCREAR